MTWTTCCRWLGLAAARLGGGAANGPARPSSRERRPRSHRSDERLEAALQRVELEAIGGGLDVAAVPLLDQRAATRLRVSHGGRGRRPAKNMLYSASSCFSPAASSCRSFWMSVSSGIDGSPNQKPDQRQPQLARVRHGLVVDQDVGRVEAADELEQVAQRDRVLRIETGAVAQPIAAADARGTRRTRAPSPRPARSRRRRTPGTRA